MKLLVLQLTVCWSLSLPGWTTPDEAKEAFKRYLSAPVTQETLTSDLRMINDPGVDDLKRELICAHYYRAHTLLAHSDAEVPEKQWIKYPLESLKIQPFYADFLRSIIYSPNAYERTMAFSLLGACNDNRYNAVLLNALQCEVDKATQFAAGRALLALRDPHVAELFDFVLQMQVREFWNEVFILEFLDYDKKLLRQVARQRIDAPSRQARWLVIQIIDVLDTDPELESVIKTAIDSWELADKDLAIYLIGSKHLPNQRALLEPYVLEPSLRASCLEALAASPSQSDRLFLESLKADTQ